MAGEADVNLLGNGTQTFVSAATNINKGIPMTTDGIAEKEEPFDMVTYIWAAWQL
jgi:hypothetical protein